MLQKLIIRNFQAHKKLEVDLDPKITTIVGPNDVGKSTIIRALYWLCLNKPSGDSFIRHGKEFCKVELIVDNISVIRTKGKNINSYFIKDKEYKSFGLGKVPEDIELLLNIGELNFQKQLDSPFWFTLSGGEVSKEINSIINLSRIDSTLSKLSSEVKKSKMNVTLTEERLTQATRDKEETSWVVEAEQALDKIDILKEKHTKSVAKVSKLTNLIKEINTLEANIQENKTFLRNLNIEIFRLEEITRHIENTNIRVVKLENLIQEITTLESKECQRRKQMQEVETEIHSLTKEACPLCGQQMPSQRPLEAIQAPLKPDESPKPTTRKRNS